MLLTKLPCGKMGYANAHVKKIYVLDPQSLIQAREQLDEAQRAGATEERIDECERAVQAQLDIVAAQVQSDQEPEAEQVKEEELVAKKDEELAVMSATVNSLQNNYAKASNTCSDCNKKKVELACPACRTSGSKDRCTHCFECGKDDHRYRDCPVKATKQSNQKGSVPGDEH